MPDSLGLSEKQRACLQLVAEGMTSKEIARELSMTSGVVDNYILAAVRVMGASSRRHAARMLQQREEAAVQRLHVQPQALVEPEKSAEMERPVDVLDTTPTVVAPVPRAAKFIRRIVGWIRWIAAIAIIHLGGQRHTMARWEIPLAILLVSFITSGALAVTLVVYYWMNFLLS